MKKVVFMLASVFYFVNSVYADSSDRFVVIYVGAGINGVLNPSSVRELMPVDYTQFYNGNDPHIDFGSNTNAVNKICKTGTCDLSQYGIGYSLELGIKLRPSRSLEFDFWFGFDESFMSDSPYYSNSLRLKDGRGYDYKKTYHNGKFGGVHSVLYNSTFNTTLTFRVWRIGFIGGVGGSIWISKHGIDLPQNYANELGIEESFISNPRNGLFSLNVILGLSYRFGKNKGERELLVRFVKPVVHQGIPKVLSDHNGYTSYSEVITMQPYMFNLAFRQYF